MGFIAAAVGAAKSFFTGSLIASALGRAALSVGLSLLSQALAPRQRAPEMREPGMQIPGISSGEDISQSFILGRFATRGHLVYRNSHGVENGTPNVFLTHVIELSDIPGCVLRSMIIDDKPVTWDENGGFDSVYGFPLQGLMVQGVSHGWIKVFDGSQTTAHQPTPGNVDASYTSIHFPGYDWSAFHIGRQTCYAILTFRYNREVFQGVPQALFVMDGIPLYDPRADSTVGGSGEQRWDDRATWQFSDNLAVMCYNLLRGIEMPTGEVYGGQVAAEDVPLSNWVAQMNICDQDIAGRKQFVGGAEVKVADDAPGDVIERLLRAGTGQISEMGGVWRARFGAPASPVLSITDDDLSIDDARDFSPIKGLENSFNTIVAQYVEPAKLWQVASTEPIGNADWIAEDGNRRLTTELQIGACTNLNQARQVATALITDHRRQRQHQFVLPPSAQILEPLDDISWTSQINGYDDKDFEVARVSFNVRSGTVAVTVRERDPDDYSWSTDDESDPPAEFVPMPDLAPYALNQWAVSATNVVDGNGTSRRPALALSWSGQGQAGLDIVQWQVRVAASEELVSQGVSEITDGGVIVSAGLLPDTEYAARARPISAARGSTWTGWTNATTPATYLTAGDVLHNSFTRVVGAAAGGILWSRGGAPSDYGSWMNVGGVSLTLPDPAPDRIFTRGFLALDGYSVTAFESGATAQRFRARLRQRVRVNSTTVLTGTPVDWWVFVSANSALVSVEQAFNPSPLEADLRRGVDYTDGDDLTVLFDIFLDQASSDATVLIEGSSSALFVHEFMR